MGTSAISAGSALCVSPLTYIDPTARLIGHVSIGDGSSVWAGAVIRGDSGTIHIGARSNVQDGALLNATYDDEPAAAALPFLIGDDVSIGHDAVLHHCTIDDAVLIGAHATISSGVRIGSHSIIGSGACVGMDAVVGAGEVWLGSPARCVRLLSLDEVASIYATAKRFVRLRSRFRDALRTSARGVNHEFDRRVLVR